MSEKSLNIGCMGMAFAVMVINVSIIELGRRGLWHNSGVGFSPNYPMFFAIVHFVLWPFMLIHLWVAGRRWGVIMAGGLMLFLVWYNLMALKDIMYVS